MADPLLTSLCTICHIQPPKYTCPRCATRTCSLACVKKHKTWSSCSGERDATAFVPREKLKTDAGIDHDYNFLTSIERSLERAERIQRVDRGILPEDDPRPPPAKRARFNKGQSRGRTKLDEGPESARQWDRNSIHRLRRLGIQVSSLPYGMERSKENKSSWNKRTSTINWQVEWMLVDPVSSNTTSDSPKTTKILSKALDETPLHVAFAEALELHRTRNLTDLQRSEEKKVRRREQFSAHRAQNYATSQWHRAAYPVQCHTTRTWREPADGGIQVDAQSYRFFFLKPKTPSRERRRLVPFDSKGSLASLLPGLDVVEFPTIYVLPSSGGNLGDGFTVETVEKPKSKKRKASAGLVEYQSDAESSEASAGGGEVGKMVDPSQEEGECTEDQTSSSGSDSEP